jgi:hypothetical protein
MRLFNTKINMANGTFNVARKIFDSDIWIYKPSSWIKIWIYILGNVNWDEHRKMARGEGYFNFTRDREKIGIDVTPDKIKKALAFFRETQMISTTRSTRGMRIKVLNYAKYQAICTTSSTASSTREAREKHETSTPIIKEKKEKKDIAETSSAEDTEFDFNQYLSVLAVDKNRHVQLIGYYFKERRASFPTKKAVSTEIGRWSKDAKALLEYPEDKIVKAFRVAKEKYPAEWRLSTVLKEIILIK